jgi:hypothetical protein
MKAYAMATCAPSTHEKTSDPLAFFRGLAVALLISLLLWIAIIRAAWWMWRS